LQKNFPVDQPPLVEILALAAHDIAEPWSRGPAR
jgi:hypothetical protein